MPKQHPNSPHTVLGKARLILDQFTVERPRMTMMAIVNGSGLPKPTVYRMLQEMTDLGLTSHQGKHYQLGMMALRLGMIAKQTLRLDEIFGDLLTPLAALTGETVITAALDRDETVYLHVIESKQALRFVAGAGARRPLPFGATGMALLSQLSEDKQRLLLHEPFEPFTARTVTDLDAYLARLKQAQADQLVIEVGEYYDNIMAIAVPVPNGTPLTFTLVGPEDRIRPNQSLIIDKLQRASAEFAHIGVELPF
ncbi:MAG: IclR family transcriptional regulator [Candidatus Promineifilaceae bacterium]